MAWTQTDLDKIEKAIAQGPQKIKFSDKEITFRSLDEMLKIRDLIKTSIGQKTNRKITAHYPSHSKGLT